MMSVNNEPDLEDDLVLNRRGEPKDVYLKQSQNRLQLVIQSTRRNQDFLRHIGNHFLEMC